MRRKLDPIIKKTTKKYRKNFDKVLDLIEKYDRICVFRHIMPDFDAMGTQMGLVTWIKDNFPNKEVHFLGDNHVTFTPRLFPETERLNDTWFDKPFLGIAVDVGNTSRIADPRFSRAEVLVKIDHHPDVEKYGKISIVIPSMCAASEIITNMLLTFGNKYMLTREAARYLYIGVVGDSGRFQYNTVTPHTFAISKELLSSGFTLSEVYNTMYQKNIDDLKVTGYILANFVVSEHGVAYYVLDKKVQEDLKITTERGKENVNVFANIVGIEVWCSVTEDPKDNCWRISIRSREYSINDVAAKWGGGGHAQASGAKIDKLEELPLFIKDIDDVILKNKKK